MTGSGFTTPVRLRLEEFPLAILEKRCSPALRERAYSAVVGGRRLSLTSAAEPGQLPTSGSMTLLLALITMYRQSAIEVRDLEFPLYQLTLAFRQKKSGRLYQRIKASLPVWNRVVYTFDSQDLAAGAGKPYHATFRVLEKCVQLPNKAWHIQWSDPVWFALMHGAWSNLDAGILFDLAPLPRQLYCFLVSRFRTSAAPLRIDLHELAFEHLGVSRSVPNYRLLDKIRRACAGLERSYLKPDDARIQKRSAGAWDVVFENPTFSSA
jgi:hypothetical protein